MIPVISFWAECRIRILLNSLFRPIKFLQVVIPNAALRNEESHD
jgi:hypothetical protein